MQRMWADAIILSPVNCQTWKSCTARTPSMSSKSFFFKTSMSMWVGTVWSNIRADSINSGHTPRIIMHTKIRLRAEKKSNNALKKNLYNARWLVRHIWLMSCPNPYKLQHTWDFIFLKVFTHTKTKWASKKFFTDWFQSYPHYRSYWENLSI